MLWLKKKSKKETFKVAVGTILVQNTNWKNVDLAISNMFEGNVTTFKSLRSLLPEQLEKMIKPAGFYKQKAQTLYSLADIFIDHYSSGSKPPSREDLLRIKGVGKESADSLLVYCFYNAVPIIGTYTRRFFARISGEIGYLKEKYEEIQKTILNALSSDYYTLGKFHALIVSHSQKLCQKIVPHCEECILQSNCAYGTYNHTDINLELIQEAIIGRKSAK
jgi:endonuclease-3 related protein